MEYKEQCDRPGRQSTHSIVIAHYTHHPSVSYIDIPVTIEECIGIIKSNADHQQTFIGNEDIIVDIWLKNEGGETKQPSLKFNTNDIQDAHYIEGNITTGPCFQCVFENDVLINNSHAIGCNVSFLNINTTERNYTLLYRGNGSSSVFDCFSWFLSGYYDICYASLFFSEDCEVSQYSVYINGTNSESQADSTDDNLLPIIIGSSVSLLVIATLIIIVAMIAIKRCVSNRKTFSPASAEQAPGGNQEGVDEIVNRPTTSLLNAPTIAPYRYGGTLNEPHDNAGPSSLNLSSDQSETRPLVNTTDRSSHSSDIIPLEERDSNLQQRKLSTVDEMETSFNDNQDNNTHSLNQMNTFVEDGDLGIPKILEPPSLSPLSHVLPTTNERRLETQQDISNDEDNDESDEVFSYPEPLQATNIQTSNSLPNFSRHHHQPSFFRTNSETGDYLKELSAVPEDNDFISFEASN